MASPNEDLKLKPVNAGLGPSLKVVGLAVLKLKLGAAVDSLLEVLVESIEKFVHTFKDKLIHVIQNSKPYE